MKTFPTVLDIAKRPLRWLPRPTDEAGIALCSRVRLARNLAAYPFPSRAPADMRDRVFETITEAIDSLDLLDDRLVVRMEDLDAVEQQVLVERRLISAELCRSAGGGGVAVGNGESLSLMINEEDHLRIQVLLPGLQLRRGLDAAVGVEAKLGRRLEMAFRDDLGFLTSCPSNVGTGLRASVMLHLPALVLEEQMNGVMNAAQKLGFAVRGALGEGTEAVANLFQISNQSTLGESELEIVVRLERLLETIVQQERYARVRLAQEKREILLDHVGRAYGIVRYAYTLNSLDALGCLSALRLGAELNILSTLDVESIDRLFREVQPGHLQLVSGALESDRRDIVRAELVRRVLRRHRRRPGGDAS